MKNFGFAAVAATGLATALFGLAPAATAVAAPAAISSTQIVTGIDHHAWLDQIAPDVNVPKVDTSVRVNGR